MEFIKLNSLSKLKKIKLIVKYVVVTNNQKKTLSFHPVFAKAVVLSSIWGVLGNG